MWFSVVIIFDLQVFQNANFAEVLLHLGCKYMQFVPSLLLMPKNYLGIFLPGGHWPAIRPNSNDFSLGLRRA